MSKITKNKQDRYRVYNEEGTLSILSGQALSKSLEAFPQGTFSIEALSGGNTPLRPLESGFTLFKANIAASDSDRLVVYKVVSLPEALPLVRRLGANHYTLENGFAYFWAKTPEEAEKDFIVRSVIPRLQNKVRAELGEKAKLLKPQASLTTTSEFLALISEFDLNYTQAKELMESLTTTKGFPKKASSRERFNLSAKKLKLSGKQADRLFEAIRQK